MILEKEIAGETSYISLFKSTGNLKRMRIIIALGFFSQWSGNGLFSYYLNEIFQVRGCMAERWFEFADDGFQTLGITSPAMKTLLNGVLQVCLTSIPYALGAYANWSDLELDYGGGSSYVRRPPWSSNAIREWRDK